MAVCWHADYVQEPPIHLNGNVNGSPEPKTAGMQDLSPLPLTPSFHGIKDAVEDPLHLKTMAQVKVRSFTSHLALILAGITRVFSHLHSGRRRRLLDTAGTQLQVLSKSRSTITQRWNPLFTLRHERDGVLVSFVRRTNSSNSCGVQYTSK